MFNGTIREFRESDLDAVEAIIDLYWPDDFGTHLKNRIHQYLEGDPALAESHLQFFVAEDNGEVVGVAALRKAPVHMMQYAKTTNPAEFYLAAAKYRGKGIGGAMAAKRFEEAKKAGYTEVLIFSAESHKYVWPIYDKHFERASAATAPNGEPGFVWRKILN